MEQNQKHYGFVNSIVLSPWFDIILMIATTLTLVIMFQKPLEVFKTSDPYPPIISLTPQKIIELGGSQTPIDVGMYIRDFSEFNVIKGLFVADVTVWFRFNPQLISLDRIALFNFEKAEIIEKSKPNTRIDGSNLFASFDVRVKCNISLNYVDFPIDDHRICFTLSNYYLSPADATFFSSRSSLVVNPEVVVEGWQLVDKQIKIGYMQSELDPYDANSNILHPRAIFALDYQREGARHTMTIFLPLVVIFFIALLSLSLGGSLASVYDTISMAAASVTALIAYRFVIESMSPVVGYFMISDSIYIYFLLTTSVILFVNIFGAAVSVNMRQIIKIVLHCSMLFLFLYFLLPWMVL